MRAARPGEYAPLARLALPGNMSILNSLITREEFMGALAEVVRFFQTECAGTTLAVMGDGRVMVEGAGEVEAWMFRPRGY